MTQDLGTLAAGCSGSLHLPGSPCLMLAQDGRGQLYQVPGSAAQEMIGPLLPGALRPSQIACPHLEAGAS